MVVTTLSVTPSEPVDDIADDGENIDGGIPNIRDSNIFSLVFF